MGDKVKPDKIIEEIGGCGRYQWRMNIIVHAMKSVICFSYTTMVIISFTPPFTCGDDPICINSTSLAHNQNASEHFVTCPKKACMRSNSTTPCTQFVFEDAPQSMVAEFELVCSKDYIPSTMMSIQIGGTLLGNLAAGQLGDLIGRKPPIFVAVVLTAVSNVVGFFSVNWVMLAIARFFIGLAEGSFMTTKYSLLSEFSLASWRVWIVGFPSWPIEACMFVLLAWLIKDWRYIQLMISILSVAFLFAWWIIPESFRWYIANDHPDKAQKIVIAVAKYNKKEPHNIDKLTEKPKDVEGQKHTILDILKTGALRHVYFLLSLNWIALGVVSYGISFGIQALSGNLYLNVFLFSVVGIPSKAIAMWLQNRFGRRATTVLCHLTVCLGGFVVGVVQTIDHPDKDALTNAFVLMAAIGIATAWGPVQTMTVESFPTVVRTVAFGTLSIFGRLAAMLGPQLVYADMYVPGILYFVCGGISLICCFACYFLPETKGGDLNDKITEININRVEPLTSNGV